MKSAPFATLTWRESGGVFTHLALDVRGDLIPVDAALAGAALIGPRVLCTSRVPDAEKLLRTREGKGCDACRERFARLVLP